MKKILLLSIGILISSIYATAQRTYVVQWPAGAASFTTVALTSKAATGSISISNQFSYVDLGILDTSVTLTVVPDASLKAGALLFIKAKSNSTARTLTPGTGFQGNAVSGVINKTKLIEFVYDGSKYYLISSNQVD